MIKIGLDGAPPITSAGIRFMIASLIIFAILVARRIKIPLTGKFLLLSLFLGIAQMGIPYALVYWGEQYIPSGLTAVLFSIMPLGVAVLARFILGDPLTASKAAGIIVGSAGLVVIFSHSFAITGDRTMLGMAAIVLSALLASLSSVIVKKHAFNYHPFASIFLPITFGAILLLASGLALERHRDFDMNGTVVLSIIYLSVLGTVGAFALYFWIIKHIDVTLLSYQTFIIPVLACFFGWIFLDEKVTFRTLIGAAMIFSGIGLAMIKKRETVMEKKQDHEISARTSCKTAQE